MKLVHKEVICRVLARHQARGPRAPCTWDDVREIVNTPDGSGELALVGIWREARSAVASDLAVGERKATAHFSVPKRKRCFTVALGGLRANPDAASGRVLPVPSPSTSHDGTDVWYTTGQSTSVHWRASAKEWSPACRWRRRTGKPVPADKVQLVGTHAEAAGGGKVVCDRCWELFSKDRLSA